MDTLVTRPLPAFKVTSFDRAIDFLFSGEHTHIVSVGHHIDFPLAYQWDDVEILKVSDPLNARKDPMKYTADVCEALAMTKRLWDAGLDVLFHCSAGQARSPAFACLMLLAYGCNPQQVGDAMFDRQYVTEGARLAKEDPVFQLTIPLIPDDHLARRRLLPYVKGNVTGLKVV